MPRITPEQMVAEEEDSGGGSGPNRLLWISEAGGLTQFGAFVETMPPGGRTSIKHWHSDEDEMVYVLEGEVTLHEGDDATLMRPGDAATFKAGVAVGHYLQNRSDRETRCLVVGTRAPMDRITYSDHAIMCHRDRSLPDDTFTDLDGNPVPNPHR